MGYIDNLETNLVYLYFIGFVLARAWIYPSETNLWYNGQDTLWLSADRFCNIMKVLCNKEAHLKRPLLRNIVFNALRCQFASVIYPIIFGDQINYEFLAHEFLEIALITYLVESFVPIHWFSRLRVIWSLLVIEYVTLFGASLLSLLNRLEQFYQGQTIITIICIFLEIHFTLMFEWLEDAIFGDMDQSYGFNKGFSRVYEDNFGSYVCQTMCLPVFAVI